MSFQIEITVKNVLISPRKPQIKLKNEGRKNEMRILKMKYFCGGLIFGFFIPFFPFSLSSPTFFSDMATFNKKIIFIY